MTYGIFIWKRDSKRVAWEDNDNEPEPYDVAFSKEELKEMTKKLKTHDGLTKIIVKRG